MKIRKNDVVRVMTGDEKGKQGKVLSVDRQTGRVLVEGVNYVWKHMRRSQQHPFGARVQKEAPLPVANLALMCPSCNKPTKVAMKRLESGDKIRICKKCRAEVSYSV